MKSTGVIRRVDELGRVVIPKEIRNGLEIEEKDPLEIYVEGEKIILKKHTTSCIFCNSNKNLNDYKDKVVCLNCMSEIAKLY